MICTECEEPFERLDPASRTQKCEPCRAIARAAHVVSKRGHALSRARARKDHTENKAISARRQGLDQPDDGAPQTVEGVDDIGALYFL